MHALGSASLTCPYPSSVSKTAFPRVCAASTEFAYLVLGSYRLPMTRIGFAVVAFHGPVYRFALGDCQEAHGAQSPHPSNSPTKSLLVRCCITVGHVRTKPGGGWGLSAHCSAVADTNTPKRLTRPSRTGMAMAVPSPLAALLSCSASSGHLAGCPSVDQIWTCASP